MILLIAVVIGLGATLLRARLSGRRLKPLHIRISWLVFLAVIPQILSFQIPATGKLIPEGIVPFILVGSQILLLVFAAANIRQPGFWALGLGLLANFTVIALNGGWMPISADTLRRLLPHLTAETTITSQRLLLTKDWIMPPSQTHLVWLSDTLTLPGLSVAFSIGDIFIALGAFILMMSLSDPIKEESRDLQVETLSVDHSKEQK